jgi:molecular chaperone HtpG
MATLEKGNISVQTENIFPIIKKFLYSDHEIFLRELVSNAVDATQKLRKLAALGEVKGEIGDTTIRVRLDAEAGTLTISDRGIGMSADEVRRYINQVAFSSASEFLEKFKGQDPTNIIGHFGLGFYSSFMVASQVEILTRSYKGDPAVRWTCDGSPEFTLEEAEREERGTDIILHITDEDNKEFLQESRISELLNKYAKFMPVPIEFGTRTEYSGEGEEQVETEVPNVINNTEPAWTKAPADLKDEDYQSFYRELYPLAEPPLFWIHLNVDYPFNLTGVLYFPRIKKGLEIQKNKIQLYSNQVFVTDEVGDIVPEWLTLLHGVIDSPDIPLNVSRSYLQSDASVKKIAGYITRKVADRLDDLFKKDRADFEAKWENFSVIVKYGMMTDEKFEERARKFCLLRNLDGKYFTIEEYRGHIQAAQTDKNDKLVALYANDREGQDPYVKAALRKGYDVLDVDNVIDNHFLSFLEGKEDKLSFVRVDADTADRIIDKDEKRESVLNEKEQDRLRELYVEVIADDKVYVQMQPMSPEDSAVTVIKPEMMRRMREMAAFNGMSFLAEQPEHYNVVVNTNHPVANRLLRAKGENRSRMARQLFDLALLAQGMLRGSRLTDFVERSVDLMSPRAEQPGEQSAEKSPEQTEAAEA